MIPKINIILLGTGNVGSELVRTIVDNYFESINIVCISDSKYHIYSPTGLNNDELTNFISKKHKSALENQNTKDSLKIILSKEIKHTVIVDVSASEKTIELLQYSKRQGAKIVLANKKPLVSEMSTFIELTKNGVGASATVGTRIPIINTIIEKKLSVNTIDNFSGCFSGSVGFIIKQMETGSSFSQAVNEAYKLGYTEPDPRDDLSGFDIGRKSMIVARFLGYDINIKDVNIEKLYPEDYKYLSVSEFLNKINSLDDDFYRLFEKARKDNKRLKYLGTFTEGKCKVGLQLVDPKSSIGMTEGSEKILVLTDKNQNEIVIKAIEPGAGAKSTVKDLINDIFNVCK